MDSNFKLGGEYMLDLMPQNVDIYTRGVYTYSGFSIIPCRMGIVWGHRAEGPDGGVAKIVTLMHNSFDTVAVVIQSSS